MNDKSCSDPFSGVGIFPANGLSALGVKPDVAHDLGCEVVDGGEDAACDNIALDFGEPDFDLIEPGGVGGSVVQLQTRMFVEQILDELGLVRGEIVDNDVNLLARRATLGYLPKEADELGAGMTGGGFADDLTRSDVQRGVKGQSAMAKILEAVALGPARRERQTGIFAIQGLDG